MSWIAIAAAGVSLALGLLGLLAPRRAATLVGLPLGDAPPAQAVSEIRATYGGLFTGLSLAVLVLRAPLGAWVLAAGWLGAAAARAASLRLDRAVTLANGLALLVELAIGCGLLL